ncbi:hypothetical protein BY996DRAFT_4646040 [Phakopsora pachyrhizi]|uniref:Uncharacterized protein n=1 Tax=Phakopsora pachyrhizi TaxID=170000 RepID=A0AAV0ATP2_PHAPC|nr:hypothetical protein BY996DRAFT_4646040 [Phakopsora pachyrhizi]CAH7672763.1 hypothetical protein PPACK8108_LOCUS7595 [Phakopsora pachyrhizi]
MTSLSKSNQINLIYSQLKKISKDWRCDPLKLNQPKLQISNSMNDAIERMYRSEYSRIDETVLMDEVKRLNGFIRFHNSLKNLSDDEICKRYPLPDSIRNPKSFPNHYKDLNEGVERAIRGERLPWYKSWFR